MAGDESVVRVAVVKARDGVDKPQGFTYFHGVSTEAVGAQRLAMHLGVLPPGMVGPAHTHAEHESAIYVLEGEALVRWGTRLEHETRAAAGDFVFVPAGMPHQAVNPSASEPCRTVIARTDPSEREAAVLLDLEAAGA